MKSQNDNSTSKKSTQAGHSHGKHMLMMAVCCGLPIVGLLAIGAIGISSPSLETLIALICPIGMGIMMFSMMRNKEGEDKGHSCCQETEKNTNSPEIAGNSVPDSEQIVESKEPTELPAPESSGSLKA